MKRIHIVGLALFAVLACSAMAAASAFAAPESGWLINGSGALTAGLVETLGLLFLDVLVGGILVVSLHCEGVFDGTVGGPDSGVEGTRFDLVTEVLTAAGSVVSAANPLLCEVGTSALEACGLVDSMAEVVPVNLPWLTEILLNGSTFEDMFPANSGYNVTCANGKKNKCEGEASSVMTNNTSENDVIGVFTETTNEATCTEGVGHIGGEGLTLLVNGEPLAVSEGE